MAGPAVRLAVALAALMAGAACSVQVVGTPSAAPTSSAPGRELRNPDRIAASDGLGDPTTWDPCSVVNPDTLPGVSKAWFEVRESLDFCSLTVDRAKGRIAIQVGWLYNTSVLDLEDFKSETREGRLRVVSAGHKGGACVRFLVFDDSVAMVVESYPENDHLVDESCDIADIVVDQVVKAVVGGRAESFEFAPNSIGKVDPCDEVSDAVVAKVPGLEKSEQLSGVSGHHCRWHDQEELPELVVEFHIGHTPRGTAETFSGRDTHVTSDEFDEEPNEYSMCTVTGEHIPFKHKALEYIYELVSVRLLLPKGQAAAACDGAKAVAAELFPKLPNP